MTEARTFGRYRVTGTLGSGAMGDVFAAVDEVLGREVAVKTLKVHANGLAARMLDERFRQEARAIAALSHPGVVQVFDLDLAADPPYLVMERVAGPSLKERLASGPLPLAELRALGIQIGRALAAAHAQKIVHRDVKPANILAAGEGTWKLADFGVAHVPDSSLTMTGQFVGSPAYAPPEALVKGQSDAEGDVYGLGATLYQAAAGSWPRLDGTSTALIPIIPPLAGAAPHLPPEVAAIIDRAVAVEAIQRPTAAEIADVLAGASSQPGAPLAVAPVTLSVASAGTAGATALRWKPWAIGGAIAIALIALIAGAQGDGAARGTSPLAGPSKPPPTEPGTTAPADELRFEPPPMTDERQVKDWNKVLDQLDRSNWSEARHKLDEWEDRWGKTAETAALGQHLDTMGDRDRDDRGPPGQRGKKRKHDD